MSKKVPVGSLIGACLLLSCPWVNPTSGQQLAAKIAQIEPPSPMPSDRDADSYRIYSMLMTADGLGKGGPHATYLLGDTTIALVNPGRSCWQSPETPYVGGMNPHAVLQAPAEQAQDLAQLLEDFDQHCHERIRLAAKGFKPDTPLRILDEVEQNEFRRSVSSGDASAELKAKYEGSPGLLFFSQVYFNAHHTVAMVYLSSWCGGLCGTRYWAAFGLDNTGRWKPLMWSSSIEKS